MRIRAATIARVRTLASAKSTGDRGLISLVAGLAAVQSRDFTAAHAAFAQAQSAGGQFSLYAQYMDALATVASDSSKGATALSRLQALSEGNHGAFAEQVRLSAAQTALGVGQYAAAASLADGVPATSGAGAQALLTKAWALYRGGNAGGAAAAFREFATRYPYLPARDEARLMAGQILLESGKSDSAGEVFPGRRGFDRWRARGVTGACGERDDGREPRARECARGGKRLHCERGAGQGDLAPG